MQHRPIRFLIAYASRDGQTERIAHHAARRIEDRGHLVHLIDLKTADPDVGIEEADAAIVAGAVHRGKHEPELARFLMRHAAGLGQLATAFLSVSLSAASRVASERAAIDEVARSFLHDCGWHPDHIELVAGAVHDRDLNALERYVVHRIVDQHGVERHPSGDTELTDWGALDQFLDGFAASARSNLRP